MNSVAFAQVSRELGELTSYNQSKKCLVFRGTDVPVGYVWDAIMNDETISDFLNRFPAVSKDAVYSIVRAGAKTTDGL